MRNAPARLLFGRLRVETVLRWRHRARLAVVEDSCRPGVLLVWKERRVRSRDPDPLAREFTATIESHHPLLVKAVDFGRAPRSRWLLREHVTGTALETEGEPRERAEVAAIIADVASALADLHDRGWSHGAVRPEHVIEEHGAGGTMRRRLLVTGSARRFGEKVAPARPQDLSPEDLTEGNAAPERDQFALGMLAYRLLTGRRPGLGRAPAPVSSHRSDLTSRADRVISRLLLPVPRERFSSIREAAEAVWHSLEGEGSWERPAGLRAAFRAEEFVRGEVTDWLREVVRHGRGAVAIWGPPGAGKRAVLRRLGARIQTQDRIWIRVGSPVPRGAGEQVTQALARRLAPEARARGRNEIARKLSSVIAGERVADDTKQQQVATALAELCAEVPVALGLEGVDRWDRSDAALAHELTRVCADRARGDGGLVLVMTGDAVQGPLSDLLDTTIKSIPAQEIRPLSAEELEDGLAERFERDSLTPEFVDQLHEHTGGLPELLARRLGGLAATGRIRPGHAGWLQGPNVDLGTVETAQTEEYVRRRLQDLSSEARRTLDCLSVVRDPGMPRRALDRALGRNWARGLDELGEFGLVVHDEGRPRFYEAETPAVIYASLPGPKKTSINRALAQVLEAEASQGKFLAARAFHLRESGQVSKAIYETLRAAEDLARSDQLSAAASEYTALLDLLTGEPAHPLRRDVLERLLRVRIRLGDENRTHLIFDELLRLADLSGDAEQFGCLSLEYAQNLISRSAFGACNALANRIARTENQHAVALAVKSKLKLFTSDFSGASALAARAEKALRTCPSSFAAKQVVQSVQGIIAVTKGHVRIGKRALRGALRLAVGTSASPWMASALMNLSEVSRLSLVLLNEL